MRRLAVLVLLLGSLSLPALAVSDPAEMLADHRQEARAEAIGSRLRCLVCQNESIEDSGADLARDLRHVVRVHVAAGDSDRQIMDWMAIRYGDFIRLQPRLSPLTLLLWAAGPLALAFGLAAAWIGMRRRPAAPPPLAPDERARIAELTR
jgi:cytochrome c-type biogenesis protein CcmH